MPTVVIGDNTGDDFSGTDDNRLYLADATGNYGASNLSITWESATERLHTIIRFTGLSNLPSSATVSSAIMSLYCYSNDGSGSLNGAAHRVLRDWVENESTWTISKTGNNWTIAGALGSGTDIATIQSGNLVMATSTGAYHHTDDDAQMIADIEDFVDGSLANDGHNIHRLSGADGAYRSYTSSEGTDGQRPYLTVVYTTGAPPGINVFRRRMIMRKAA